jgi:type II secretory pathway predicted ATPase ExeA/tetratricopeptide (TPR) repeat protein
MDSPFGLREEPFDTQNPLRAPFASADHKEAFNGFFLALMARKRIMALFGETGMGKTTLLRSLIRHVETDGAVVLAVTAREGMTVEDLILAAGPDLETETPSQASDPENLEAVVSDIEERLENAGTGLFIVDEAHALDVPVLLDLVELASSDTETGRYLQVLVAGDHRLERKLAEPDLEAAFREHGVVHYLPPLDRDATEAFIRDRLRLAGAAQQELFLPGAADAAARLSSGLPGVLSALCGQALRIAVQSGRHRVDVNHIQQAAATLGIETVPDIEIDIPDAISCTDVREPVPAAAMSDRGAPRRDDDARAERAFSGAARPSAARRPPVHEARPAPGPAPHDDGRPDSWPDLAAPQREDVLDERGRPKPRSRWVAAGLVATALAAGAGWALSPEGSGALRFLYGTAPDMAAPSAGVEANGIAAEDRMAAMSPPPDPAPARPVAPADAAPSVSASLSDDDPIPAPGPPAPPSPQALPVPAPPEPAPVESAPPPDATQEIARLIAVAKRQIAEKLLTTPAGDNAYETYRKIVALTPDSPEAAALLAEIKDTYLSWARTAEERGAGEDARRFYERALSVDPDDADVARRLHALDEPAETAAVIDPVAAGQILRLPPDYVDPPGVGAAAPEPAEPAIAAPAVTKPADFTTRDGMLAAIADPTLLASVIASGGDLDHELPDGKTALMLAAERGRSDAVLMLLEAGAAPNARSRNGGTALMYAAGIGDNESIRILVRHGGAVNAMNVDGKTALMAAAQGRHAETVRLLLDSGADMNARTVQGRTALDYAEEAGDHASATLLRLRGARSGEVSPTAVRRSGSPQPGGPIDLRAIRG